MSRDTHTHRHTQFDCSRTTNEQMKSKNQPTNYVWIHLHIHLENAIDFDLCALCIGSRQNADNFILCKRCTTTPPTHYTRSPRRLSIGCRSRFGMHGKCVRLACRAVFLFGLNSFTLAGLNVAKERLPIQDLMRTVHFNSSHCACISWHAVTAVAAAPTLQIDDTNARRHTIASTWFPLIETDIIAFIFDLFGCTLHTLGVCYVYVCVCTGILDFTWLLFPATYRTYWSE